MNNVDRQQHDWLDSSPGLFPDHPLSLPPFAFLLPIKMSNLIKARKPGEGGKKVKILTLEGLGGVIVRAGLGVLGLLVDGAAPPLVHLDALAQRHRGLDLRHQVRGQLPKDALIIRP